MRIAEAKVGEVARFGRRVDLLNPQFNEGRISSSCPALILAVGPYTIAPAGHCGERLPALLSEGPKKVVILRQADNHIRHRWSHRFDQINENTTWHFDVVSPSNLMSAEEWDVKTFPMFEMQLERSTWQKRYNAAKKELTSLAGEKVNAAMARSKLLADDQSASVGLSLENGTDADGNKTAGVRLSVYFDVRDPVARKLLGTKKVDELIALAATRPDACSL